VSSLPKASYFLPPQVLPDMLKNAPMFKRIDPKIKGQGGRGIGMAASGKGRGGVYASAPIRIHRRAHSSEPFT
jgi:hypothetical protein